MENVGCADASGGCKQGSPSQLADLTTSGLLTGKTYMQEVLSPYNTYACHQAAGMMAPSGW